jgi:hypothetical protein
MAQAACRPDEAFDILRRASQRTNIKVRDLAADIVQRACEGGLRRGPQKIPSARTLPGRPRNLLADGNLSRLAHSSSAARSSAVGAGLATVSWVILPAVGGICVRHVLAHGSPTCGFFAIVIGLLSWMYMGAQLTLLAAEINVVRLYNLRPRSITQPPLMDGDRRTFARLARIERRRPEAHVSLDFSPDAHREPLNQ